MITIITNNDVYHFFFDFHTINLISKLKVHCIIKVKIQSPIKKYRLISLQKDTNRNEGLAFIMDKNSFSTILEIRRMKNCLTFMISQ